MAKFDINYFKRKAEEEQAKQQAPKKRKRKAVITVKETDAMTGIKLNTEGKKIKEMTEERAASMSPSEKLQQVIRENNIPMADEWLAVDVNFFELTYNQTIEKAEMGMMNKLQEMMTGMEDRIVGRLESNEVRLAELRVQELELQLELARLQAPVVNVMAAPAQGKTMSTGVTEIADPDSPEGMYEEIVGEFRLGKVGEVQSTGVTEDTDIMSQLIGLATPITRNRKAPVYTVKWSALDEEGFMAVIFSIVQYAIDNGVDVSKGNKFKTFSSITNGAYQQFQIRNRGTEGAWASFINEYFGGEQ